MKTPTKVDQKSVEKFDDWMRNKVKSVFYADNKQMVAAYKKVV